MKNLWFYRFAAVVAAVFFCFALADGQSPSLPPQKKQATPQKVIQEHTAAWNSCDWKRLMAQYSDNVEFLAPGGAIVSGRQAIGDMFAKLLKPHSEGGYCGMKQIPEHTVMVGDTVNMVWRFEAPFLAEPYRGSEAFETKDGLLVFQVTTFDLSQLKMKK
jgi:hypothetical protein